MHLNEPLIGELLKEAGSTRKILERVPEASFSWKPHPNSMSLGQLASHIAEIPFYLVVILTHHELDFASANYTPANASTHEELMKIFEYNITMAQEELQRAENDIFSVPWTLRNGDHVIVTQPKSVMIRNMALNHMVHHRGQLSVYLRLLNIPIPGMYGPSFDESFSS